MNRVLAVSALVIGLSVWSTAYADTKDSPDQCEYKPSRHQEKLLNQLPAEKADLFRRTMTDVKEKRADIRDDILKARAEVKDILVASEFNESLFKEKTARVQELAARERQVWGDAITALAKQYTPEERKLLVELISRSKPHRRWSSHRQIM